MKHTNGIDVDKTVTVSMPKVNRDKWKPLDGTFAPPAINAWNAALRGVDRSNARLSSKPSKEIYGYRFPDPGLIAYAEHRLDRYVINWLHIRVAVQHRVYLGIDNVPTQIPVGCSNEEWRSILNSSYGQLDFTEEHHQSGTHLPAASSRRDANSSDNRRELIRAMFGVYPSNEYVTQASWGEHVIMCGKVALLDPTILREIVWDLCEHNFRADLLALDRLLAPAKWGSDYVSRDELLKSVFADGESYICTSVPSEARGIASSDWRERREFIGKLALVMGSWPSAPADIGHYDEASRTEVSFARIERIVALFFCQTIFDQFGRPAIVPHRIRY